MSHAQKSVGIGIDRPHPNAVLHLNIENPLFPQGLLLPRLNAAQRGSLGLALESVTSLAGMTVFDVTDNTIYVWTVGGWAAVSSNPASQWITTTIGIYYPFQVGINGIIPNSNTALNIKSTGDGSKPIRVEYSASTFPLFEVDQGSGSDGSIMLYNNAGVQISQISATNPTFFNGSGNVGIGTINPNEKFTVEGNSSTTGIGYFGTINGRNLTGAAGSVLTVDGAGNIGIGTLSAGITGTGAANQIAFWSGTSTISSNQAITWNSSSSVLGLGGTSLRYTDATSSNVVVGQNAGNTLSTGQFNVFVGVNAGQNNNTGTGNVFVGYQAGQNNTGGNDNVFMGNLSGFSNQGGNSNFAAGYRAGFGNVSGNNNFFFGSLAGSSNISGSNNIAIGLEADFAAADLNNAIAFGSFTTATGSNQIVLGYNITGVGINTNTPTAMLDVNGGARIRALSVSGSVLTVDGLGNVGMGTINSSPWLITGLDIYYNSGRVGIGTVTPDAMLHVLGGTKTNTLSITGLSGNGTQTLGINNNGEVITMAGVPNSWVVTTGGITYTNDKVSVGVGTVAGSAKFKVDGQGSMGGMLVSSQMFVNPLSTSSTTYVLLAEVPVYIPIGTNRVEFNTIASALSGDGDIQIYISGFSSPNINVASAIPTLGTPVSLDISTLGGWQILKVLARYNTGADAVVVRGYTVVVKD